MEKTFLKVHAFLCRGPMPLASPTLELLDQNLLPLEKLWLCCFFPHPSPSICHVPLSAENNTHVRNDRAVLWRKQCNLWLWICHSGQNRFRYGWLECLCDSSLPLTNTVLIIYMLVGEKIQCIYIMSVFTLWKYFLIFIWEPWALAKSHLADKLSLFLLTKTKALCAL